MKKSAGSILLIAVLSAFASPLVAARALRSTKRSEDAEKQQAFRLYENPGINVPAPLAVDEWKFLEGFWLGGISEDLRLLFRITSSYGQVFAYSLDQVGAMIPATATHFDDTKNEIRFYFDTIGGVFKATLDEDGQQMTGTWMQGANLPLVMRRFQSTDSEAVPREFRFLVEKVVTGNSQQLDGMAGFWSGYLEDPPELVIVEMDKTVDGVVEPKLLLPDETPLPAGIRSFFVSEEGKVKIVADYPDLVNAIFEGSLDGKEMTGVVEFDDDDYTPPLKLVWSPDRPSFERDESVRVSSQE